MLPSALQDPRLPAHLASRPCLRRLPCPHDWLCPPAHLPARAHLPRPVSHPQGAPNMPSAHAPAQFLFHPPASPPHLLTPWASTHQPTIVGAFRGPPSPTAPRSRQASGAQPLRTTSFRAARPDGLPAALWLPLLQPAGRLQPHPMAVPAPPQGPCTPQPPPSPCHHPSPPEEGPSRLAPCWGRAAVPHHSLVRVSSRTGLLMSFLLLVLRLTEKTETL